MTSFRVENFGGVIPLLGPRLLPVNGAQAADNAKLFSGELRSWRRTTVVNAPVKGTAMGVTLKSMYRMYTTGTGTAADRWASWVDDVDVVKGPIAGDTQFKLYYTGDLTTGTNYAAGPRKTNLVLATGGTDYPHDFLEMGVPAPAVAPSITSTGGTSTSSVTRVYTYTFVTNTASWAEEGPPSPTGTGTGKTDATFIVSGLSTGTTGKYAFTGGVKRIYRTLTDNAGNTNYQLALEVPMVTTSTGDAVPDGSLGVICPTFQVGVVGSEWIAPPSDMKGIIALPNGMMAGFSGNLVCFCEPFFPHAWPLRYKLATNFDIVGLGVFGQTLIVTTKGYPYAISGARPDSMSMTRIEQVQPCVSKRGIVSFPFGVAWPTPDGLALAGVGGSINAIEQFMKRDEWRGQCFPETLLAHRFQDVYFGFFNNGSVNANFIFDKTNNRGPLTFGNFGATGVWNDPETSKLYLIQNNQIAEWDSDQVNNAPFDWRSKVFVMPKPVNFGVIQVDADYGPLSDSTNAAIIADNLANLRVLGTSTTADTDNMVAWAATSSYGTGTSVKSADGHKMAVCIVAGTSSNVEFTYPGTLGGTATDGTVRWKRVWEVQSVTRGCSGEFPLGYYNQLTTADPVQISVGQNGWGFPLAGSLLVGGQYANFDERSLLLQVYAQTTGSGTDLQFSTNLFNRNAVRMPAGFKSDTWEVRLSGSVAVRYFKVAETAKELSKV